MLPWLLFAFALVIVINLVAGGTTYLTSSAMRTVSDFATAVRQVDSTILRYYNAIVYPFVTFLIVSYAAPLLRYAWRGAPQPAPVEVRQRALSAPLVIAMITFAPWLVSLAMFPLITLYLFERWSLELMSQQILSPLVNGFLAATTSYFLLEAVFRHGVVPRVFGTARLLDVPGVWSLGVRGRLALYVIAVAFLPLFTMLGLARGAADRIAAGVQISRVVQLLEFASLGTFVVYVTLGVLLTFLIARWLTGPLQSVAAALREIERGGLEVDVPMTSDDEVGRVEDGVNKMAAALRDNQRILQTFGRIVEPTIRDRLLSGDLPREGELRPATILFCDLRDFTAFTERSRPEEVVATLNAFFSAMTAVVREQGGFVDKFIGDALLVVFGLFDEDDGRRGAHAAVRCGLAMEERLAELNRARRAAGEGALGIAGSVHTGDVLAGIIGADDRHEFTVIGDAVNVAARLLQVAKDRDWDFVLSGATYDRALADGFDGPAQRGGFAELRGRREKVEVVQLG